MPIRMTKDDDENQQNESNRGTGNFSDLGGGARNTGSGGIIGMLLPFLLDIQNS